MTSAATFLTCYDNCVGCASARARFSRERGRVLEVVRRAAAGQSTPNVPVTGTLLAELEGLEARITAARHVSIQPGSAEDHDDLADALALGVWLAREYEIAREDARRRGMRLRTPPPSAKAWT